MKSMYDTELIPVLRRYPHVTGFILFLFVEDILLHKQKLAKILPVFLHKFHINKTG